MQKTISYIITACTEVTEFHRLLNVIKPYMELGDSIDILIDNNPEKRKECNQEEAFKSEWYTQFDHFGGNFAEWKNKAAAGSTTDYLFQIDADEYPDTFLLQHIHEIIEKNNVDLIFLPRANKVAGITEEDLLRWHWVVNDRGYVNWPDYQGRIYRNAPEIKWSGKVHEKITGHKTYATFPADCNYCLYHNKTIDKQRMQNSLYDQLLQTENK